MLELFLCEFYFLTFLNLVSSILNIYSLSKGFTYNNNNQLLFIIFVLNMNSLNSIYTPKKHRT